MACDACARAACVCTSAGVSKIFEKFVSNCCFIRVSFDPNPMDTVHIGLIYIEAAAYQTHESDTCKRVFDLVVSQR